jgi:hypothetical protein
LQEKSFIESGELSFTKAGTFAGKIFYKISNAVVTAANTTNLFIFQNYTSEICYASCDPRKLFLF